MKLLYRKNICLFWYTLKETNHIIITNRPPRRKGGRGGGERRGEQEKQFRPFTNHKSIITLPVSCCRMFSVKYFTSKRPILPNTNHRFLFLFLSVISFFSFFFAKIEGERQLFWFCSGYVVVRVGRGTEHQRGVLILTPPCSSHVIKNFQIPPLFLFIKAKQGQGKNYTRA